MENRVRHPSPMPEAVLALLPGRRIPSAEPMPGRCYPGFHDSDAAGRRCHERDCTTGKMVLMRALIAASPQQTRAGLPQDWQQQYDITPVPMRTFVEIPRFPGITYKASGWFHVGTTQGRGRYDTKMEFGKPNRTSGSARWERTGKAPHSATISGRPGSCPHQHHATTER